jgi:hypothetical protein
MQPSPEENETISRFEKLLAGLARSGVDYFRPRLRYLESSGTRIPYLSPADLIFLKQDSWRDKDKLDVLAMREILAREARQ